MTPFGSRASILRDVHAGSLRIRTACMFIGSMLGAHDDDHEPQRCAVPECFQCTALAWADVVHGAEAITIIAVAVAGPVAAIVLLL